MKKLIILSIIALVLLSCGKKTTAENKKEKSEKVVPVIVEKISERNLQQFIYITGKLEGVVDITMTSETSGKIIELNKQLGDQIEKGETIGRIDNRDLMIQLEQAKATLLAAEAAYELAEMNWETAENLYEKKSISALEYTQTKSSYKSALANVQAAKAGLERSQKNVDNSILLAPVSGNIASLSIEIGSYLGMGQPIASIVNTSELIIKTGIGERSIQTIQKGQEVFLQNQLSDTVFSGTISGIGLKPISNTANYPIEIKLENPENLLLPGMVMQGKIVSKTYQNIIYTNLNNIIPEYDNRFVYVIDESNLAKRRYVQLGAEIADNVIIQEGLAIGDRLVVEGIANLEDDTQVEIRMINE